MHFETNTHTNKQINRNCDYAFWNKHTHTHANKQTGIVIIHLKPTNINCHYTFWASKQTKRNCDDALLILDHEMKKVNKRY